MQEMFQYVENISAFEFIGLCTGLLTVVLLIRQNILTWPMGIIYVLVSLIIFLKAKLYADFVLHIVYLVLNGYGWYYWYHGKKSDQKELEVSSTPWKLSLVLLVFSGVGIWITGYLLHRFTDASLPYWDSATTILSFTGIWVTARKKI